MEELFDVPATREAAPPALTGTDGFISMVLSQPDSAEKVQLLRELIAMQNEERKRKSKEAFDFHFAELRKALKPVVKNKFNAGTNSKYAELEHMQRHCDPVIFEHGFTYSWNEMEGDNGRKTVIMHIYGYGHTEDVLWTAPAYEGNRAINPLQSAGIQSAYGQRYTYKSGFGIVLKGEDTDGQFVDIEAMRSDLDPIRNAKSTDALMSAYQTAYTKHKDDQTRLQVVVGAYNLAKQALIKGGA